MVEIRGDSFVQASGARGPQYGLGWQQKCPVRNGHLSQTCPVRNGHYWLLKRRASVRHDRRMRGSLSTATPEGCGENYFGRSEPEVHGADLFSTLVSGVLAVSGLLAGPGRLGIRRIRLARRRAVDSSSDVQRGTAAYHPSAGVASRWGIMRCSRYCWPRTPA